MPGLLTPNPRLTLFQYTGNDSLYTFTFEHEKRPECPVCGGESIEFEVERDVKFERVLEMLTERQDM
jgi:ubiquitin-activating enzyme E1 C